MVCMNAGHDPDYQGKILTPCEENPHLNPRADHIFLSQIGSMLLNILNRGK